MSVPAIDSTIDAAYWFFNRAEDDGLFIEDEKLQHLLFLAQVHYAAANNMEVLMPSLFLCDENGFFEPTLRTIFAQGRPFMPPKKPDEKISSFLEEIWLKYAKMSLTQLTHLIKSNPSYQNCFAKGAKNIADLKTVVDNFINNSSILANNNAYSDNRKKISFSQNGPVIVSKWKPRKVSTKTLEGE